MTSGAAASELIDRRAECAVLDRALADVRSGQGRALLIRGEAGVGKSALLEHLMARSTGCRIARAAGVESEMELPFAGLHQLCAPMLDLRDRLPGPQSDALAVAFGASAGSPPDKFLVGLAVLSLLAAVSEDRPLAVCGRRRPMAGPGVDPHVDVRRRAACSPNVSVWCSPCGRRATGCRTAGRRAGMARAAGVDRPWLARRRRPHPAGLGRSRPPRRPGAGSDCGRDPGQPPGPARVAARVDGGRAGRRVRARTPSRWPARSSGRSPGGCGRCRRRRGGSS